MKAHFEQVNAMFGNSFLSKRIKLHHFDTPFHFHPEYELTFIVKSEGKRFVGNHFENFYEGDLLLLGKDIPHCWKNEYNNDEEHVAEAIVIQFREDFLGKELFYKPELAYIKLLLERSQRGIKFHGKTAELTREMMENLIEEEALKKVICLLQILNLLSESEEYTLLTQAGKRYRMSTQDCDRINKIYSYVSENFHSEISLKDVAALVHMTPSSFCRYFKKVSRKTLNTLINEYRIELAKHMLNHTEESISAICFECGFQNISNFNKRFREVVNLTPSEYRTKFSKYLYE